jgi:hypothetical protein
MWLQWQPGDSTLAECVIETPLSEEPEAFRCRMLHFAAMAIVTTIPFTDLGITDRSCSSTMLQTCLMCNTG